jgi:hypothetical protein
MKNNTNSRRNFLSKMLVTSLSGVALFSSTTYARGRTGGGGGRTTTGLTNEQKDTLFFIYQEEKVARDVYITLGNIYTNENTFASIQKSEQRHIDSARDLCEKYGVDITGVDEGSVGDFELQPLQELYDNCVAQGSDSLIEALKVGVFIEITDIDDLERAAVGMPNDVVNVYENLKEGSLNHLDAFETAVAREQ